MRVAIARQQSASRVANRPTVLLARLPCPSALHPTGQLPCSRPTRTNAVAVAGRTLPVLERWRSASAPRDAGTVEGRLRPYLLTMLCGRASDWTVDCTTCIAKRRMDGGVHLLNLSTQTLDLWGVRGLAVHETAACGRARQQPVESTCPLDLHARMRHCMCHRSERRCRFSTQDEAGQAIGSVAHTHLRRRSHRPVV